MQAVILAAGEGKRMRPLTLERPKPLIRVAGRPLIEHILAALPPAITEIIIIIGYKGDMIRNHVGAEYLGRPIRYVVQDIPDGTARALALAEPYLTGTFLLLAADDIHGAAALEVAATHPLALLVSEHPEPERFGVVIPTESGMLGGIVEKPEHPQGNLVSTGAMVLDRDIFSYESRQHASGEYYLTEPLALLARARPVTLVTQPLWIPVGRPEDIGPAEVELAAHNRTHL